MAPTRGKRTYQFKLILRPELAAKLRKAAGEGSLNSEMERRLEESFTAVQREDYIMLTQSLLRDMRTLLDLRHAAEDRAKKAEQRAEKAEAKNAR